MRENFKEEIPPILFNIKKFNNTSIELTWNNDSNNTVRKYIIIMIQWILNGIKFICKIK